jgi:hypothetical protein
MRLSDGKYKRTKVTVMRVAKSRSEGSHTIGGRKRSGAYAPKPITLPAMPWDQDDKSNNAPARDDGK